MPRLAVLAGVLAVLIGGAQATAAVPVKIERVRYTLTVTFDGGSQRIDKWHDATYGDGWSWDRKHTTYLVRSTRPFWIERYGPKGGVGFTTKVDGTLSHLGNGWRSETIPLVPWIEKEPAKWYYDVWRDPRMAGKVFASGGRGGQLTFEVLPTVDPLFGISRFWSTGEVGKSGIWFASGDTTKAVDWTRNFGKAFSVTHTRPGGYQDAFTTATGWWNANETMRQNWTLRFTPTEKQKVEVQRWQVEVRGTDTEMWGEYTGLRAGADIDWAVRTTLELEDGEITSAQSKVHVLALRPVSEPPGAFSVTGTSKPRPAWEPKATKNGNRVTLNVYRSNRSEYYVKLAIRAVGPQILDQLRKIGVANPEADYQKLLTRGPIEIIAADKVPLRGLFTVPLEARAWPPRETDAFDPNAPCVRSGVPVPNCFFTRGGEQVTVTRLK